MAVKAVTISGLIILPFAFGGAKFLQLLGISLAAFRIFGGLLLFLIALEMVYARESGTRTSSTERAENQRRADVSVFPLAFPFIAGPGALATILLWFGPCASGSQPIMFLGLLAAATLVLAITLAMMWLADPLQRVLGVTGANVANRLAGVISGRSRCNSSSTACTAVSSKADSGDYLNRYARFHTACPRRSPRRSNRVGARYAGRGMK